MLKSARTFTRMGEGVATSNGNSNGDTNSTGGFSGIGDLSNLFNDSHNWDNLAF
jgi:hypothetical protein